MLFEVREALSRTYGAPSSVSFELRRTVQRETRRVLGFATRHGAKPAGFWALPLDMERNPPGFGLCHLTWSETRRVLGSATSLNETRRVLLGSVANADRSPIGRGAQHTFQIRKVTRISCIYLIYAYF